MHADTSHRLLRFGPFEVDVPAGQLRKHGVRVQLAGQPFQVLVALLDEPGSVVARERLRQLLWADDTFVDFDKGLNTAVNKLRQALGDAADRPHYVETLPGRGYRFIAPLQVPVAVAAAPDLASGQPAAATWPTPRVGMYGLSAGALLAAVGLLLAWVSGQQSVPAPIPMRFLLEAPAGTTLEPSGSRQGFALSPDGRYLAMIPLAPSGTFEVWMRDLASLEARPMADTSGVHSLFWSADSRTLFLSGLGSLRRAAPGGGAIQAVTDVPASAYQVAGLPRDRLLISSRGGSHTVASAGGPVTSLRQTYGWPQTLPDGERLLYVVFDERRQRNQVRVSTLGQDAAVDVLESDSRAQVAPSRRHAGDAYVFYVRAGTLLAQPIDMRSLRRRGDALPIASNVFTFLPTGAADFSVSQAGMLAYASFTPRSRLAWLDRKGKELGTIGPAGIAVKYARLSPDGRRVAAPLYDVTKGLTELWIFDVDTGAGRRLASSPALADAPVWSPDSTTLVYGRALGGAPKLYSRGTGPQDPEKAMGAQGFALPADWSPDGRFVLFSNTVAPGRVANEREGDVSLFDVRNGATVPLLNSRAHETGAAFSPDGQWLAFVASPSGRQELYVQRLVLDGTPRLTGEPRLVSRSGALAVRWRRDGKELFYLAIDGSLHSVAIAPTTEPSVGAPATLFTIPAGARAVLPTTFGFDVSPDGQRFLVPVADEVRSSLVVVHDWEAQLR